MKTFRATLRLRSAAGSPWQADMLFGHLCWQLRYQQGEPALADLLARYRAGEPPLLLSDGFPAGWLPRPLGPGAPAGEAWVSHTEFAAICRGEPAEPGPSPNMRAGRVGLKSAASRAGASDPAGDRAYHLRELAPPAPHHEPAASEVDVYLRAADDAWAERAQSWLQQLARGGYGARKSAGYGQIALGEWQPWPAFEQAPPGANGFVSLANWAPARHDPTDGDYVTLVKYGKLGEALASAGNPHKHPLLLLAAGSRFRDAQPRPWYGRLVERIAVSAEAPVVQYAYALAVPCRIE